MEQNPLTSDHGEKFRGRCSSLAHDPHGKSGLIERAKVNDVTYMHVVYICINVLMNYDCTTHPISPFITITTKFFSRHCIKRVLDTETNGYHFFNFTEKLSYEVWTLYYKQPKNVKCSLWSITETFPKLGRCEKISRGKALSLYEKLSRSLNKSANLFLNSQFAINRGLFARGKLSTLGLYIDRFIRVVRNLFN